MTGTSILRRPLALLVAVAALGAAGCGEDLTTSSTCPELCPEQNLTVQQVELTPVVTDTVLAGFPVLGAEQSLLVARAGDTLDVRAIIRFDSLPDSYRDTDGTEQDVEQVVEPAVEVLLARRLAETPTAITLEAYDVAVTGDDTSAAVLATAFTPERLLGTLSVPPVSPRGDTVQVDTLAIPIDPAVLLARIEAGGALRVGLRVTGAPLARLPLDPSNSVLTFAVSADSGAQRLTLAQRSLTPENDARLRADQSSFTIVVDGTLPPPEAVLAVGGLPGRRSLLRFQLPREIVDSSTVLRATLVLTQRPVRGYLATDTLLLQPLAVTTRAAVTDLRRRVQLAANARNPYTGRAVLPVDPLPVVPGDSGEFLIEIPELVGAWRSTNSLGFLPELVLASSREGWSPLQAQFYSLEAPVELRPRLRLNYIRRINFDLP
ncbi:MAG TPA: hypothetical protein VFS08_21155 [Gemmatimonadaceae bacterium]|nr:hypothetical protein [Gemmatimonadaceae bacterium]